MKAGKDVYVEKPMVQELDEGQPVDRRRARRRSASCRSAASASARSSTRRRAICIAPASIGELNLVEAWINRNSAIGAWQYSIPPDASPQTDRLGPLPAAARRSGRSSRSACSAGATTATTAPAFPAICSCTCFPASTSCSTRSGPTRVFATGGLRYWKDGRDVPDVMLALYDYPKTAAHPAFTLALKVNFAEGAGDSQAFRFVGPDGVITIGGAGVTLARRRAPRGAGLHHRHLHRRRAEGVHRGVPREVSGAAGAAARAAKKSMRRAGGYSDTYDHFVNFFDAVRTRKPVVEDAAFGFGPRGRHCSPTTATSRGARLDGIRRR